MSGCSPWASTPLLQSLVVAPDSYAHTPNSVHQAYKELCEVRRLCRAIQKNVCRPDLSNNCAAEGQDVHDANQIMALMKCRLLECLVKLLNTTGLLAQEFIECTVLRCVSLGRSNAEQTADRPRCCLWTRDGQENTSSFEPLSCQSHPTTTSPSHSCSKSLPSSRDTSVSTRSATFDLDASETPLRFAAQVPRDVPNKSNDSTCCLITTPVQSVSCPTDTEISEECSWMPQARLLQGCPTQNATTVNDTVYNGGPPVSVRKAASPPSLTGLWSLQPICTFTSGSRNKTNNIMSRMGSSYLPRKGLFLQTRPHTFDAGDVERNDIISASGDSAVGRRETDLGHSVIETSAANFPVSGNAWSSTLVNETQANRNPTVSSVSQSTNGMSTSLTCGSVEPFWTLNPFSDRSTQQSRKSSQVTSEVSQRPPHLSSTKDTVDGCVSMEALIECLLSQPGQHFSPSPEITHTRSSPSTVHLPEPRKRVQHERDVRNSRCFTNIKQRASRSYTRMSSEPARCRYSEAPTRGYGTTKNGVSSEVSCTSRKRTSNFSSTLSTLSHEQCDHLSPTKEQVEECYRLFTESMHMSSDYKMPERETASPCRKKTFSAQHYAATSKQSRPQSDARLNIGGDAMC